MSGRNRLKMKMRVIASVIVLLLAFGAFAQNPGFRLAQTVLEIDSDANGKADSILVWSYTYNKRNDVISSVTEYDDGDGSVDAITKTSYVYGPHHNLIRVVQEDEGNADGIVDEFRTRTQTYVHGAARH